MQRGSRCIFLPEKPLTPSSRSVGPREPRKIQQRRLRPGEVCAGHPHAASCRLFRRPGSRLLWLLPGFLFWGQLHGQLSDGGSQLLWQHHHHSHWRLGGQESHAPPCPPALLATHRGLHTAAPGMASRRLGNRLLRRHQVKWPQTPLFQAPPSSPASLSPEWHRGQSQEDTLFPTWPPTSDSAGRQPVQRTCSEVDQRWKSESLPCSWA